MYKTHYSQVAVNVSDYLQPAMRLSRHLHELPYHIPSASVDYIKFSFFPRTASDWNMLLSRGDCTISGCFQSTTWKTDIDYGSSLVLHNNYVLLLGSIVSTVTKHTL